jgi:hypothetical protein
MRILMYGFSTQTNRVYSNSRFVKFVTLLSAAFRSMGHEVHVGLPPEGLTNDGLNSYDKVFIGIGSPTSFSSETVYESLYIIGKLRGTEKLTIIIDDPDVRKIMYGISNWVKNPSPENIFRDAYKKRPFWYDPSTHSEDAARWTDWHVETCRFLAGHPTGDPYPPVLLPLFAWGKVEDHRGHLPSNAREVVQSVDLSALLSVTTTGVVEPRNKIWIAANFRKVTREQAPYSWTSLQHTEFPVHAIRNGASDTEHLTAFKTSWGVLHPPMTPYGGWWSTTMIYSVLSGALYMSNPDTLTDLGPPFNLLAAGTEHLSDEQRLELADQQRSSFINSIATKDMIRQTLQEVLS